MRPNDTTRRPKHLLIGALLAVLALGTASEAAKGRPHMRKPRRGVQLVVGPTTVPRGYEVTECTYLKLPTNRSLAVNRIDIKVKGGSHHIHLYRPHDPAMSLADGHETCNFALDFEQWGLILASQVPLLRWKLPPGVAFHFSGGEQLAAQTHYVDVGLLETPGDGWAVMNLHAMPERKVTSYAGAFFGQDRDVDVPPQSTVTATTRCLFPRPVKLLGITGHYHFRGTRFTAGTWDGTTGNDFYESVGYEDPAFVRYGARDEREVPGLQWTCTYENATDTHYTFGPFTEDNEHCNLFAFYYPSEGTNEFMTCVQKEGAVTVEVHGNAGAAPAPAAQ